MYTGWVVFCLLASTPDKETHPRTTHYSFKGKSASDSLPLPSVTKGQTQQRVGVCCLSARVSFCSLIMAQQQVSDSDLASMSKNLSFVLGFGND